MPFRIKVSLAILALIFLLFTVGPFLVPIPELEGTVPARQLADEDSRFITLNGLELHYKTAGDPEAERSFLLLHGFGSSLESWMDIMPMLAELGYVVAFDRPAFGLTERPLEGDWQGPNPYSLEAQVALTLELIEALELKSTVLVGNSAGGTVAVQTALEAPERLSELVLISAAVFERGGTPAALKPLLFTPQLERLGPYFMRQFAGETGEEILRSAWSDPESLDEARLARYRLASQVEDWDRALWELTKASRAPRLQNELALLSVPTLVIAGADDVIVPVRSSQRLADMLDARLDILPACGHVPQEECPDAVMQTLKNWLPRR